MGCLLEQGRCVRGQANAAARTGGLSLFPPGVGDDIDNNKKCRRSMT